MVMATVGVIGGSGLYQIEGFVGATEVDIDTPFGKPSDRIVVGELAGVRIAFLPRHGRGHRIGPSEIPQRANIYALKALGIERLISVSAVGSMREGIHPLDMVVPDQIYDRTTLRPHSFFTDGIVAHVGLADPYCPDLSDHLAVAAEQVGPTVHRGGTYVCIEGPQFSTRAESRIYRQWGVDVIGMTAMPEARLAREAELCYATLALVTDYDVWHETSGPVTVGQVEANLGKSVKAAQETLKRLLPTLPARRGCNCGTALAKSIVTAPNLISPEVRQRLGLLLDKYLPPVGSGTGG
ncbi:MAG TPA: S-methyl-5'-thioadenosine phosphorylase [Chloroflexota bacterium]|nr:S-methyl-5'-thioadenosine phosphorylase [Chloroflexota bacterium]